MAIEVLVHRPGQIPRPTPQRRISLRRVQAVLTLLCAVLLWVAAPASAVTVVVPDDFPTIQAGIDAWPDSVLVRPGSYPETLVLDTWDFVLSGLVPPGAPPDSQPVVAGLVIPNPARAHYKGPSITIANLHFSGPVRNTFNFGGFWNEAYIVLSHCVLDAGIDDAGATMGGQLGYDLRSCTIHGGAHGAVFLVQPQEGSIASCDIRSRVTFGASAWSTHFWMANNRVTNPSQLPGAGVEVLYAEESAGIAGNTFEGWDVAMQLDRCPSVDLTNNTLKGPGRYGMVFANYCCYDGVNIIRNSLSGFGVGVEFENPYANGDARFSLADNRIEGCGTAGVRITGAGSIEMDRDTMLSCGAGAILAASSPYDEASVVAGANVILSCTGTIGMSIDAADAQVMGNLVGRCGGDGIIARCSSGYGWPSRIRGNTSVLNTGSGFVLTLAPEAAPNQVDHDIGYGNGRHGLEISASDSVAIACNDWFGNAEGAVQGAAPSSTDLAVDPEFCSLGQGDAHLMVGSPLANAGGCGLIGALGVGCESSTTPVFVDQFTAWRDADGEVVIGWRIRGGLRAQVLAERAEREPGPWVRLIGIPENDDGLFTLVDPDADATRPYWYRLIEVDPQTGDRVVAMSRIDASARDGSFVLEPIGGNPGAGPFTIRFSSPRSTTLDLEVFDLLGRRIARLASGLWAPGSHELSWSGCDDRGRRRAGVYMVRFRFPAGQATRSLALVR